MNNASIIHISIDYKTQFENVIKLFNYGVINSFVNHIDEENNIIYTSEGIVFQLDKENETKSQKEEDNKFNKDGAPWFESLRTGKINVEYQKSLWTKFLKNITKSFYEDHFYFACYIPPQGNIHKLNDFDKTFINNFLKLFFPKITEAGGKLEISDEITPEQEDVIAVTYRMFVSTNNGYDHALIGRSYFSLKDDNPKLLPKTFGDNINKILDKREAATNTSTEKRDPQKVGRVFDELFKIFTDNTNSYSIDDYMSLSEEKDAKFIDTLMERFVDKDENGILEVPIKNFEILNVQHITYSAYVAPVYFVKYNGAKRQRALTIHSNGEHKFSIDCSICDNRTTLMDTNTITINYQDGTSRVIEIKMNDKGEIINEKIDIDDILNYSAISKHNVVPTCPLKCQLTCSKDDSKDLYCSNCNNPTVVYHPIFGNGKGGLTRNLKFNYSNFDLINKNTRTCKCNLCRRSFDEHIDVVNGYQLCPACKKIYDYKPGLSTDNKMNETYKKYRNMFPLLFRILSLRTKNNIRIAIEDKDYVIFRINESYFTFDKLSIVSNKFIDEPIKRNLNKKGDK